MFLDDFAPGTGQRRVIGITEFLQVGAQQFPFRIQTQIHVLCPPVGRRFHAVVEDRFRRVVVEVGRIAVQVVGIVGHEDGAPAPRLPGLHVLHRDHLVDHDVEFGDAVAGEATDVHVRDYRETVGVIRRGRRCRKPLVGRQQFRQFGAGILDVQMRRHPVFREGQAFRTHAQLAYVLVGVADQHQGPAAPLGDRVFDEALDRPVVM